jgi:hypothetical protein
LVNVTGCDGPGKPTATEPKLKLCGATKSIGTGVEVAVGVGVGAAIPVPVIEMTCGLLAALSVIVSVAER